MSPERKTTIPTPFNLNPNETWKAADWMIENLKTSNPDYSNPLAEFWSTHESLMNFGTKLRDFRKLIGQWTYHEDIPYNRGLIFGTLAVEKSLEAIGVEPQPIENAMFQYFEKTISPDDDPEFLGEIKKHLNIEPLDSIHPAVLMYALKNNKMPKQFCEKVKDIYIANSNDTYHGLKQSDFPLYFHLNRNEFTKSFGNSTGFVFGAIDGYGISRQNIGLAQQRGPLAIFELDDIDNIEEST